MVGFHAYVHSKIPPDEDCPNCDKLENFANLMHLMDLVLQKPKYYRVFEEYCKNRRALQKYCKNGVSLPNGLIGYVSKFYVYIFFNYFVILICIMFCLNSLILVRFQCHKYACDKKIIYLRCCPFFLFSVCRTEHAHYKV